MFVYIGCLSYLHTIFISYSEWYYTGSFFSLSLLILFYIYLSDSAGVSVLIEFFLRDCVQVM